MVCNFCPAFAHKNKAYVDYKRINIRWRVIKAINHDEVAIILKYIIYAVAVNSFHILFILAFK